MATVAAALTEQLQSLRRKVDFDTFDVLLQQLLTMIGQRQIEVAPAYQRKFRWDDTRCSQLVESVFLGIPIPSLFMAADTDGTWELVDGVQRVCAIVMFAGDDKLREILNLSGPLVLSGLEKLEDFNGKEFSTLPANIQLQFLNRPIKVVTLSDKSDAVVRFDLFERLNRGGVTLTEQEIRDCVHRGPFADLLESLGQDPNFQAVARLNERQNRDGTREECVLRFFAYLNNYQSFVHSVRGFLNDYMKTAAKSFNFKTGEGIFHDTFRNLALIFPNGLIRPGKNRRAQTSLVLFEAVAVGAALAIQKAGKLKGHKTNQWLGSEELRGYTTGATNSPAAVRDRIHYCRDRFLGL